MGKKLFEIDGTILRQEYVEGTMAEAVLLTNDSSVFMVLVTTDYNKGYKVCWASQESNQSDAMRHFQMAFGMLKSGVKEVI